MKIAFSVNKSICISADEENIAANETACFWMFEKLRVEEGSWGRTPPQLCQKVEEHLGILELFNISEADTLRSMTALWVSPNLIILQMIVHSLNSTTLDRIGLFKA